MAGRLPRSLPCAKMTFRRNCLRAKADFQQWRGEVLNPALAAGLQWLPWSGFSSGDRLSEIFRPHHVSHAVVVSKERNQPSPEADFPIRASRWVNVPIEIHARTNCKLEGTGRPFPILDFRPGKVVHGTKDDSDETLPESRPSRWGM